MRKSGYLLILFTLLMISVQVAVADNAVSNETSSPQQAIDIVKKAINYIKTNGTDKAYALFDDHTGPFVDKDLYVVVYDFNGKCLAHGANEKLIGRNLIDAQDVDGKYYVKERVEMAKTNESYWTEYKFSDPITKKLEPKSTYCEKLNDTVVCAGVYNQSP